MMVYTELINQISDNAGINTSSIDPRTVKVFYKGIQMPIYFFGEQNGVFDDNDYFDFYGQRNYGGNTVTYKKPIKLMYPIIQRMNIITFIPIQVFIGSAGMVLTDSD